VGLVVRKKRKHCIILFTNYTTPGTTYSFKAKKEISISKKKVDFKSEDFESKQVFTSKMEQKLMIITYKKLNGKNQPCFMVMEVLILV
jgi:prolyl oligopeptidase